MENPQFLYIAKFGHIYSFEHSAMQPPNAAKNYSNFF